MDLSTIPLERIREIQCRVRDYVEYQMKRFIGISLENIEKIALNEITRNLLESYIGTIEHFSEEYGLRGNQEWKDFSKSFDLIYDSLALYLLNYGIDPRDYKMHKNDEKFQELVRIKRDKCLKI